ncbi:MAG: Gfo/Idh/MocA family oxidoreductase [Chloroflexota bacterium]|nr:Gfo/Idh/MocA family oxidoreductase [Chloroflexota bacterium]
MPAGKLHIGVLGTARIADALVTAIKKSSNCELMAVASRDEQKALSWAQERDVPHHFGSYEDLLGSDLVDAIYIPLPNGLHKEWSLKAAGNHKHVLCEKPIGTSAQDVEELIAARDKYGVVIMEAFMYRFHPQTARIRQLLADRAIGDIKIARATFDFYLKRPNDVRWDPQLGGGALADVGCYCASILTLVAGTAPTAVTASAVWGQSGVDTSLVGTLEFPGDLLGIMDCSFQVGSTMQQWLQISGTEGLIKLERPFSPDGIDATIIVDKVDGTSEPEHVHVTGANQYQLMVEHFARAALEGHPLSYPLEDSLVNMRVLDALLEAAHSGQRVKVEDH